MDRIKLLCDISELNHLFRDSVSVENFLQRTVLMVTEHMKTDVCSIYLYEEDSKQLIMRATEGLCQDAVGHVGMQIGEGLTGLALKEMRPVCVSKASKHPSYKLFVGTDEEIYDNFLAVPITRGISRIGVLVLQRKKKQRFREEDVLACKAVASQLANIIENAKFLMTVHQPHEARKGLTVTEDLNFVRGKVASEGYAFSEATVVDKEKTFTFLQQRNFSKPYKLEDFDQAVIATNDQLSELQNQVEEKLSDAASLIFASHLLILKDNKFIGAMREMIESGTNPPDAILTIAKQYIDIFAISSDSFLHEKVQDVEDLVVRLIGNLVSEYEELGDYHRKVVIARELFPSDLLRMSSEEVRGIVLVGGGITSHLSILARSLQIPMVIANNQGLLNIPEKTKVIIDAEAGNVYVEPGPDVIEGFEKRNEARAKAADHTAEVKPETFTADGTQIHLMANINLLSDLNLAEKYNCEGVGLYRTEFPFIIRSDFPSEQEQFVTYRKLFEATNGKPVTLRTLDIGGDKVLSYYHNAKEQNPSMGMRSIRFSLQNKKVFTKQLRAMLRAGVNADMRIMFPMVSSIDEFREAKDTLNEAIRALSEEGKEHNPNPQVGMMVEIPAVLPIIESFAKEVDFFSIGTNDFIQFMLGVDRTNENVEGFYLPYHPAVLRALQQIVEGAAKHGKEVSICGDMAHQGQYVRFLLGIGIRTLSVDAVYMPRMQNRITQVEMTDAKAITKEALAQNSIKDVARVLGIRSNND